MFSSLLFSAIGFYLFRAAKDRSNVKLIPLAIALMAYSYFTSTPLADWGVGFVLCGLSYLVWE